VKRLSITAAAWFRAIADALHGRFHGNGHVTFDGEAPEITRMLEKAPTLAYQAAHRWKTVGTAACN
jgi:hypothetical protein